DPEEVNEILRRLGGETFKRDPVEIRQESRSMLDVGRFVPLSSERDWRQEGTIGFNKKFSKRNDASRVPQILGLLERDVSRERDHKSERHQRLRHLRRSAEAVHYSAETIPRAFLCQYLNCFVIRVAAVNYDRKSEVPRYPNLSPENLLLDIARTVVVVIVEPDLAPRDNFFRLSEFDQMFFGFVVVKFRVVRVDADARKDILVLFGNRDRLPKIVRMRIAGSDIQHR